MGIRISKDHLHPSVIESITSLIGDLSQLETTAKGNAVEAINELLANSGNKEELEALITELKSILEDEGVSVTEEDDMASLISKVDEEFAEKNNEIKNSGGLDIISATELPATGKENQICVITDNPVNSFMIASIDEEITTNSIIMQYTSGSSNYVCNTANQVLRYNFYRTINNGVYCSSYYWNNSNWNQLTKALKYIIEAGQANTSEFGSVNYEPAYWTINSNGVLAVKSYTSSDYYLTFTFTNKIDFNNYSTIYIEAQTSGTSIERHVHILALFSSNSANTILKTSSDIKYSASVIANSDKTILSIDISNWTGEYYLSIAASLSAYDMNIYNVYVV